MHANAFSRVNSSEPSYRLPVASTKPNGNHSHHSEILNDVLRLVEQYSLADRIHLRTKVGFVARDHKSDDGWVLGGRRNGSRFTVASRMAVLCTNRRLGRPRQMILAGEDQFAGQIFRGPTNGDE